MPHKYQYEVEVIQTVVYKVWSNEHVVPSNADSILSDTTGTYTIEPDRTLCSDVTRITLIDESKIY